MLPLPPNHHMLENVSRETISKLSAYSEELILWNQHINLIAKSTEGHIWERHIIDSLQITKYIDPSVKRIVDFGSGGGMPAIILAIVHNAEYILIESDKRKCEFLRNCKIKLQLDNVRIYSKRIEVCESIAADLAISRACAPLTNLLKYMHLHTQNNAKGLFLKGKSIIDEITFATAFSFDYTLYPSITSADGVVVEIANLEKKS